MRQTDLRVSRVVILEGQVTGVFASTLPSTLLSILVFGGLVMIAGKMSTLSSRVDELEERLMRRTSPDAADASVSTSQQPTEQEIAADEPPDMPAPARRVPSGALAPAPPRWDADGDVAPPTRGVPSGALAPSPPRRDAGGDVAAPPQAPSRTQQEWEELIGGNWFNRIGALALILGMAFFLKYAFDNNWITHSLQIAIGVAVGATLLLTAQRTYIHGYQIFSQGMVGAGTAILYLSVYASFNFYHLVPLPAAFSGMAVVTLLAFVQALYYDSLAVSLLAWAGGFLTPFLLNSAHTSTVGLIAYVLLLDIGIVAIVARREAWIILETLAVAATYITYFSWYTSRYHPADLVTAAVSLTLIWALFHAADVLRMLRGLSEFENLTGTTPIVNVACYCVALFALVDPDHHALLAPITILIALVYAGTVALTNKKLGADHYSTARQGLTALALVVIATAVQFHGFTAVMLWSLEALVVVWCGARWNVRYVWQSGLAIYALSSVYLLGIHSALAFTPISQFRPVVNQRALTFVVLAASMVVGILPLRQLTDSAALVARTGLAYSAGFLLFLLITVETNDYFRHSMIGIAGHALVSLQFNRLMVLPALWMGYSMPLVWYGLRNRSLPPLLSGLGVAAIATATWTIGALTYQPIQSFMIALNPRAIVAVFLLAGLLIELRWLRARRSAYEWIDSLIVVFQFAIFAIGFELITAETRDLFERQIAFATSSASLRHLQNVEQLTLSGVWLAYAILLMVFGIWRRIRVVRLGALGLLGAIVLKIFIYDLSFLQGLYRSASFVALGLILLAVSYVYQRYRSILLDPA